jgi:hypothetical protein
MFCCGIGFRLQKTPVEDFRVGIAVCSSVEFSRLTLVASRIGHEQREEIDI